MCVFCKIVKGEIPAYTLYEDDLVMAFLDISQATIGHTLVVPKEHYENIFALNDDIAKHLFATSIKIAKRLKERLDISNLNIINNNGPLAGQTVSHFHIHLLPRYDDDKMVINYSSNKLSTEQFNELLEKLRF